MKFFTILCLLFISFGLSAQVIVPLGKNKGTEVKTAPQFEIYQNYEGRFQVEMPMDLTEKNDTIQTSLGQTVYHTIFWRNQYDGVDNKIFSVDYFDLPTEAITSDSTELIEPFFTATMESAAFSVNGEIIYSEYEELSGFPGYFWRIDSQHNTEVVKSKSWLVDNRMYILKVVSKKEKAVNPESTRFFNSFKLLIGKSKLD